MVPIVDMDSCRRATVGAVSWRDDDAEDPFMLSLAGIDPLRGNIFIPLCIGGNDEAELSMVAMVETDSDSWRGVITGAISSGRDEETPSRHGRDSCRHVIFGASS